MQASKVVKGKTEFEASWKKHAKTFLQEAMVLDGENKTKSQLPKKFERLASFYLTHACDRQLQCLGLPGYAWYLPESSQRPWLPGPLLVARAL